MAARLIDTGQASLGQSATVTLTRAHRDGIYREVASICGLASDLPLYLQKAPSEPRDADWIRNFAKRLAFGVRLLDQLGWLPHGDREAYELELDDEIVSFMQRLGKNARSCLAEDQEMLVAPRSPEHESEEEYEASRAMRRRLMEGDLDALGAVRLIEAAYSGMLAECGTEDR